MTFLSSIRSLTKIGGLFFVLFSHSVSKQNVKKKHTADNCVLYLSGGDAEMNFVHSKIVPASLRSLRKQSSRTHFPRLTKADEKSAFFGCRQYLMYGKSEKALNSYKYNFNNLEIEI